MSNKAQTNPTKTSSVKASRPKQGKRQTSSTNNLSQSALSSDQSSMTPAKVLALQRTAGNKAVQRLLAQRQIQTKLNVGPANDHYEQEADHVAAQVMSQPAKVNTDVAQRTSEEEEKELQTKSLSKSITPIAQRETVKDEEEVQTKQRIQREAVEDDDEKKAQPKLLAQREAAKDEEEVQTKRIQREAVEDDDEKKAQPKLLAQRETVKDEEEVQTKRVQREAVEDDDEKKVQPKLLAQRETGKDDTEGFEAGNDFEKRVNNSRNSGKPLPSKTRAFMEARFGADFSDVRIHTDAEAAKLAREINAQAFTQGTDIYLDAGKEDVESESGKELLAHELTHVVQQTGAKRNNK